VVVVVCVVNVVSKQSWFVVMNDVTRNRDLFFGASRFGNELLVKESDSLDGSPGLEEFEVHD
jgi:hypothetical protein